MHGSEIIISVLAGSAIMLSIAITVIYFITQHRKKYLLQQNQMLKNEHEKQRELLIAIIAAQEEERNRLANDLHDSVGAELSMLKLNLSKYSYFFKQAKLDHQPFERDIHNLDETIDNIRAICRDLYPVSLQTHGFIKTFEELMTRINTGGSVVCKYKIAVQEHELGEVLENKLNLLRIFQEVINNLIKYANCSYLDIGFLNQNGMLFILLKHDGVSFDNAAASEKIALGQGLGLSSINNRIYLMNGKIDYFRVSNGSEIIIQLPLAHGPEN